MTAPTEDRFRALARSGPWRFTTLRFTHRRADGQVVEATLRRPGWLRVRTASGVEHVVDQRRPRTVNVIGLDEVRWHDEAMLRPHEVRVALDADGFVLDRPRSPRFDADDPLWGSYDWVAMLDPVELSTGTTVRELASTTRHGRETWWAQMSATDDYEPRCGCCPLLWGAVSERLEAAVGGPTWAAQHPDVSYPASWLVGLDAQTGVVVSAEPLGGDRDDLGFGVTIHAVDDPADGVAAG
ncbi:hypothetical protein G7075_07495 [Phycicoccus sp. HDW14]|uniref:hypothetical protein n=1 Tax=Phycicoccus sp. HDW14 TaxID=2714941 RepID=UPI0014084693|nr:hypothetical protein [Phycicoccus sp. HDW14]QIM21013.1 hypothetical protein G7075_07495 [Phycicoccus sp. HDW14]